MEPILKIFTAESDNSDDSDSSTYINNDGKKYPIESIGIHLSYVSYYHHLSTFMMGCSACYVDGFTAVVVGSLQATDCVEFQPKFSPFNTFQKKSNLKHLPQANTHSTTAHKNTPKNRLQTPNFYPRCWFTFKSNALQAPTSKAFLMRLGLVTSKSSPTICCS